MDVPKDAELLEQVFSKIGMADDKQFESLISSFLAPVVEKLSSPYQVVKNQV